MVLSMVDADIFLFLVITLNAAVLSRNSSQDELMSNDQGSAGDVQKGCPNWQGMLVADGEKYVPNGNDMCMQCTCDRGFPIMCHSVACSPPHQCSSPQQVKEACCEYICLDDRVSKDRNMTDIIGSKEKDDTENITNLSLRLIASTVTSFLVLALLLFMVHRLRQRRLLLAMRRFETQSRQGHTDDTDSDPYIPDTFMSLECPPYTDPPPPYSPPKPPQILPGEQPPPYDEINHNVDETNADENRNQIRGVPISSGSGHGIHGCVTGQRRTAPRNHTQSETDAPCQAENQLRSFEPEHHRSGSDNFRPPNTLPAYASTDVVEGLGVVISPGSDVVCYSAGWNIWSGGRAGQDRHTSQAEPSHQRSPNRGHFSSSHGPSISRVHTMPTTTAFQRFSNIFRRDSWKLRNLRHQSRSVSDYSAPPHYATVPRNEQSPCSRVGSAYPQARGKSSSRPYSSGFPDTLYLSYDTGQATYTLGAISPSTSSSNSSEHYDQTITTCTVAGSTTLSTTPGTTSSGNSVSPPEGHCLTVDNFLVGSVHRQQFHDDLCRHLPPLQLSDVQEVATREFEETARASSPKSTSTDAISNNVQYSRNMSKDVSLQRIPGLAMMDCFQTRETNLHRQIPSNLCTTVTLASPAASFSDHDGTGHQPLSSAIDNRGHSSGKGGVPSQSSIRSNYPVVLPSTGDSPRMLGSTSCQNYYPPLPHGNSNSMLGQRNSRETAAMIQETRNSQEPAATQEPRNSPEISTTQELRNSPGMATVVRETRMLQDIETRPGYVLALAREFQIPCRSIFPFTGSHPHTMAAAVCTTSSTINIPPPATSIVVCASSSPSPSPPAASIGILRRSQSGASQTSMFSVCSETGETKLKDCDIFNNDTHIISADTYLDHHSLSRSRPLHCQEPQGFPAVMPLLPPLDTPDVCLSGTLSGNPIDVCENKCQQNSRFNSQYSQNKNLSSDGSTTSFAGLVATAAFPSSSNSTSSHPITISSSSFLSSCGDTLPHLANGNQDEDCWNSSIYNFNSLAEIDKSIAVKDVPALCEADQMTQSVNIPPLPPSISGQSSKILKSGIDDTGSLSKSGKTHEGLKKLKKKRTKDRSLSSPQFCNIIKHTASSPKHHCSKTSEGNKETNTVLKPSDSPLKDKEAMVRVLRPADKKHRAYSNINRPHVRLCDSLNCNKIMTRSAGDAGAVYGNADVYRSIGGEVLGSASSYQHPSFGQWNQQGATGGCDHGFSIGTAINDLNQPPSYLKSQAENSSPLHAVGVPDGPIMGKGDLRKKGAHKRQPSAGERTGHTPSPNRYKSRPKSLAAPDAHMNSEKRPEALLPRPSLTTGDFGLVGKGARSGFGHDLNFDDQSGIADLHIYEADFGNRRVSIGQENHMQPGLCASRKSSRAEGNCETGNVATKLGTSSYSYHPGSRSGLSNELSFTSRPALASSHGKKRQSLPTGLGGAFLGIQDRVGVGATIVTRPPRQGEGEGHTQVGQIRSACLSERRADKPIIVDDYIEATSYV